jgi:GNAT superfamily N-acetyltransferase
MDYARYIPRAIGVRLTRKTLRYYLNDRLQIKLGRELIFYEKYPDEAAPESNLGRYQIRWMSAAELAGIDHPGGFITKERAVRWLLEKPCRMVGALDGNRLVGYCWIEMNYIDFDFLDVRCPLAGNDIYISKLLVLPGQRFGLGKTLMQAAIAEAGRLGCGRVIGSHVPENVNVRRIYAALGWSSFQQVSFFRVGPLRRYVISDEGGSTTYYSAYRVAPKIPNLYSRMRAGSASPPD